MPFHQWYAEQDWRLLTGPLDPLALQRLLEDAYDAGETDGYVDGVADGRAQATAAREEAWPQAAYPGAPTAPAGGD